MNKKERKAAGKPSLTKKQIVAAHKMAAKFFRDDSLNVDDEAATELAEAIQDVAKEFNVVISGKAAAGGRLALALLVVELPIILKVLTLRNAKNQPKEEISFEPVIPAI